MAVRLIFSFDSEDYITPSADDAEKWWAGTMSKHGITACICVVGELVRALQARGRQDVLAAMASHEIAYHSDKHSAPPTWAEILDECGWQDGIERILKAELKGINDVRESLGQHPSAWCKPGNSWGAQVAAAMSLLNIPIFCDSPFALQRGQPFWFANTLTLQYHIAFDHYFDVPPSKRLRMMQDDFLKLCSEHDDGYIIMFTHPSRLVTADFWDAVNFREGKNPPREQWKPAPLRPQSEIASLQQDFDRFLSWVVKQHQVELTTYRQLFAEYKQPAPRWISIGEVFELAKKVSEFTYQPINGDFLSPAEQFSVFVRVAAVLAKEVRTPEAVPVRQLFGPPTMPPTEIQRGEASLKDFLSAVFSADEICTKTGCVPDRIVIGRQSVGPNAFMQAISLLLRHWQTSRSLPASIPLSEVPELPKVANEPQFRNYRFKGTWVIFPPEFEGLKTLEHIRLQTWTVKPAIPTRILKSRNDGATGR
ncbi:MAG: hypothetical protein N3B10_07540 [Armatimonadetes bacterium]|nr:hypothetical protein [Armatimonadota bacterium]MCX7968326.1 hypothetical protein [Armatimonadota bacterium]MDW8142378.1 hypothetical protein [Armatimonadota bacterium]